MPDLAGSVVFIEDDSESNPVTFVRDLTSLIELPGFNEVRRVLIGRFQTEFDIARARLAAILAFKPKLDRVPVLADVDFGHIEPILTIPVDGPRSSGPLAPARLSRSGERGPWGGRCAVSTS